MWGAIVCKQIYLACTYAVFAIYTGADAPDRAELEEACRQAGESDRLGELVSIGVGDLVLHSGKFSDEIFLRGEGTLYGFIRHKDPNLVDNCERLLTGVFRISDQ